MIDIQIENLNVSYFLPNKEEVKAIKGLSCLFPKGMFSVISGPSGSGKSTLIKTLSGLLPYDGLIKWGNEDFADLSLNQLNSSYLAQDFVLYPKKDVFFNLAFPLLSSRLKKDEIREKVYSLATSLGIAHCLARGSEEISFGQQQLVALGKCLIKNPSVVLLDEPFSGLDKPHRDLVGSFLKQWGKDNGTSILYVGHSVNEAIHLADRIFLLADGSVQFQGNFEELKKSPSMAAHDFLRGFSL